MNKWKHSIVILIILLGILGGYYLGMSHAHKVTTANEVNTKVPLYWIDPMEPAIHYPKSGKSRMGMELVPVYADDDASQTTQPTIKISSTIINSLGVRTAPVIKGTLTKPITTVGYVQANENNTSHVHIYTDGWISHLQVKAEGTFVKKGQLLFQLYSPTVINAQQEYLLALASNNVHLIEASRKKLLTLGMTHSQIQQLYQSRRVERLMDVYAHQQGIVSSLNVRAGMRITPENEIMTLTDLSSIWMIAEVMENQTTLIKLGLRAEARLPSLPGKVWQGQIDYVYPELDTTTRTLKVRLRFDNPGNLLKPNMLADITLFVNPRLNALSIPLEALIPGQHTNYVIKAIGAGRFQQQPVVVGIESGNRVEILSGLKQGDKVVISAQFLIDSEANLKSTLQRVSDTVNTAPVENKKD